MTLTADRKSNTRRLSMISRVRRTSGREEGSTMVEMALVCAFVFLPLLFGIFQISYGLYIYNYVGNVAHQATRYAAVRGSESCIIQSNFVDCNLSPGGSTNPAPGSGTPLQNYVQSYNYAGIDQSKLSVTAQWYSRTNDNSSGFSIAKWDTECTASTGCNAIGNAVKVTVTYNFALNIPFWKNKTLPINGISMQMITE